MPDDPSRGGSLDPSRVLKSLVLSANSRGDKGFGRIQFVTGGDQGAEQGTGLRISSSGIYYEKVYITFSMEGWNLGFVQENTTALLHELGHAMNDLAASWGAANSFRSDSISDQASRNNTALVQDKCIKGMQF